MDERISDVLIPPEGRHRLLIEDVVCGVMLFKDLPVSCQDSRYRFGRWVVREDDSGPIRFLTWRLDQEAVIYLW